MIYIPTYGRLDNQKTYARLTGEHKSRTIFVIRKEEVEHFKRKSLKYIVCDKKGVPAARQAAVEHSRKTNLVMLDDDLSFSVRSRTWSTDNPKLIKATEEEVGMAIEWMLSRCGAHGMAGLGARGGNNSIPHRGEMYCTRIMRAFGISKKHLTKYGIRFDKYLYWEDFHVNLCLLKNGVKTAVNVEILNDAATNTKGGCSTYRHLGAMRKERNRFLREHGKHCSPVEKSSASWGAQLSDSMTVPDLRIQWRKTYEEAIRNSTSGRKVGAFKGKTIAER